MCVRWILPVASGNAISGGAKATTTIVAPVLNAGTPIDASRDRDYEQEYGPLRAELPDRLAALVPPEADVGEVATAIAEIVDMPFGTRPFRFHIDPSRDGSEVVSAVADRIRSEFFHRVGIEDLLTAGSSL